MAETCLNCKNLVSDNFCGNCGQKKYKRIDKKYIWDELQYTVLHTNKGFLYSVKNIIKNPGKTAKDFINGNRVNHYKPILLVFVLNGISALIFFKFLNIKESMDVMMPKQNVDSNAMANMFSFMASYFSFLMILCIPIFALTTKIAFRKWGNNYYEHIVMNAYILSFYTLTSIILMYPVMYIFRHSPDALMNSTVVSFLILPILLVWFFKEYYKEKPLKLIILKVLGVFALSILSLIIFSVLAGVLYASFAVTKG